MPNVIIIIIRLSCTEHETMATMGGPLPGSATREASLHSRKHTCAARGGFTTEMFARVLLVSHHAVAGARAARDGGSARHAKCACAHRAVLGQQE